MKLNSLSFELDNDEESPGASQVYGTDSGGTKGWQSTLSDGDKGDLTIASSLGSFTIDNDVVTFAKMQNIAQNTLLGRYSSGSGDPESVTLGAGFSIVAGALTYSSGSSGEANTASNVGAGQGLFKQKSSLDLEFYTLTGQRGISVGAPSSNIIPISLTLTNYVTIACSSATTAMTAGAGAQFWEAPYALTVLGVQIAVQTASSSGDIIVDVNDNGTTIFTTRPQIAQGFTDTTTAAVLNGTISLAAGDRFTFDIDSAGSGAKNLQVTIYYTLN